MKKIITVVGTRPELIKMSALLIELEKYFQNILVHTGQNYDYELNKIFFDDLNIKKPNYFLEASRPTATKTIAEILSKSEDIFLKEKPEALLIYGDTNSCLVSIAAKKLKIPIFHFEAGNRCFDQNVPEEINRKIVDHISDVNFTLSEHARRYLIAEGIRPELIFKVGSHLPEVIEIYKDKIKKSLILEKLNLKKKNYLLFSFHREENVDKLSNLKKIMDCLDFIQRKYKLPIIVTTHPRTKKRIEQGEIKLNNKNIKFMKPFSFSDYLRLQIDSFCVISDSGTITEEASILNFPAVTLRNNQERPEGMDSGVLVMSGLSSEDVDLSIKMVTAQYSGHATDNKILDYGSKKVSEKICKIILSYIGYINKYVWRK